VDLDELEQRIRRLEELERTRAEPWPDPGAFGAPEVEPDSDAALWTTLDADAGVGHGGGVSV
jgi:hypothetical protein